MTVAPGGATLSKNLAAGSNSTGWRERVLTVSRRAAALDGPRIISASAAIVADAANRESSLRPTQRPISTMVYAANPPQQTRMKK